jgi:uncharacterized protein (TIGR00725 family)
MPIQVAVCGPADCTEQDQGNAREIGRLVAQRGGVLLCGGYGGVMAAAAAGAREAGGVVVGILSGADRQGACADLTVAIPTGIGQARNSILVNSGDAVIVVGGSWGTLSELAIAMRRGRVPVVQIGGWRVVDRAGGPVPGVLQAATSAEALDLTGLWGTSAQQP